MPRLSATRSLREIACACALCLIRFSAGYEVSIANRNSKSGIRAETAVPSV